MAYMLVFLTVFGESALSTKSGLLIGAKQICFFISAKLAVIKVPVQPPLIRGILSVVFLIVLLN